MKQRIPAERSRTNESLRGERDRTDQALVERQKAEAAEADDVVQRARETADAVLDGAREKADRQTESAPDEGAGPVRAVATERKVEDAAIEDERAAADESLRIERESNARALRDLLPLERVKTDRSLLTERARTDDALASSDDFLSIVAHDLRNLVGGVVMSAALLAQRAESQEAGGDGAAVLAEVRRIQRYAARMNRLIGDLLDVGSIEAGRLAVVPSPGDMAALVAEAVDAFKDLAHAAGVTLTTDAPGTPLPGEFDHDRMLQVLANLVTNAIKFTPRGGTIRIHAAGDAGDLHVGVEDTGSGIPPEMLEAVFERFWQVTAGDRRGMGLGLYISRRIVEAHGGTIRAESTPGKGSRFTLTIPAVAPVMA